VPRVREVWIFGSYARGALELGDVDLAVEFDQTKDESGRWFATLMRAVSTISARSAGSFAETSARSRST
jgi:predicted nucleotidyltransferase